MLNFAVATGTVCGNVYYNHEGLSSLLSNNFFHRIGELYFHATAILASLNILDSSLVSSVEEAVSALRNSMAWRESLPEHGIFSNHTATGFVRWERYSERPTPPYREGGWTP